MLKLIKSISHLSFSNLMSVYSESNAMNGLEQYSYLDVSEQLNTVEMDFYHYLCSVFFRQENSFYAVWEASGKYLSALRIEPYLDGYLLCALETSPMERGKGYAKNLLRSVIQYLSEQGSGILYSHVSKKNNASLAVHRACSFDVIKDHAVYSDGSVLHNHFTLALKY